MNEKKITISIIAITAVLLLLWAVWSNIRLGQSRAAIEQYRARELEHQETLNELRERTSSIQSANTAIRAAAERQIGSIGELREVLAEIRTNCELLEMRINRLTVGIDSLDNNSDNNQLEEEYNEGKDTEQSIDDR